MIDASDTSGFMPNPEMSKGTHETKILSETAQRPAEVKTAQKEVEMEKNIGMETSTGRNGQRAVKDATPHTTRPSKSSSKQKAGEHKAQAHARTPALPSLLALNVCLCYLPLHHPRWKPASFSLELHSTPGHARRGTSSPWAAGLEVPPTAAWSVGTPWGFQ